MSRFVSASAYSQLKDELRDVKVELATVIVDHPDLEDVLNQLKAKITILGKSILNIASTPVQCQGDSSGLSTLVGVSLSGTAQSVASHASPAPSNSGSAIQPICNPKLNFSSLPHPNQMQAYMSLQVPAQVQPHNTFQQTQQQYGQFGHQYDQSWRQEFLDPAVTNRDSELGFPSMFSALKMNSEPLQQLQPPQSVVPHSVADPTPLFAVRSPSTRSVVESEYSCGDFGDKTIDHVDTATKDALKESWQKFHESSGDIWEDGTHVAEDQWQSVSKTKGRVIDAVNKAPLPEKKSLAKKPFYSPLELSGALSYETAVNNLRAYQGEHSCFIKDAFEHAITQKTKLPHFILIGMFVNEMLTHSAFMDAFAELFVRIDEFARKAPTVYAGLGMSLATMVKAGVFSKADLSELYKCVSGSVRVELITQINKFTAKNAGQKVMLDGRYL